MFFPMAGASYYQGVENADRRAGKGFWKKIQFNDLDIQSLMSLCEVVEEAYRLGFYKRIADICLFVLGIFPDFAEPKDRYPVSGQDRPRLSFKGTLRSEDYEEEGFVTAASRPEGPTPFQPVSAGNALSEKKERILLPQP